MKAFNPPASGTPGETSHLASDLDRIRQEFPILGQTVHGKPLVYLDNAATTQKPRQVIRAITDFYETINANIHRGVHLLSQRATDRYERSRVLVQKFLNARSAREIIFVGGTTAGINLVAESLTRQGISDGDEILISEMEHHSNIVPWQMACEETGAKLRVIPLTPDGELDLGRLDDLLTSRTRLLSIVHVSNALGTVNPVKKLVEAAHRKGALVFVDGAQSAPHLKVDVQDLDCDFFAFSGHKIYGPTGIGVLFGKEEVLQELPPYQGGGDMIESVSFDKTTYNVLPYRFEAGTPNICGVIALGEAIKFVQESGREFMEAHEAMLLEYATAALQAIPGLRIIGNASRKAGAISFIFDEVHAHDVGTILDQEGIAVRTGHHCAQPVMDYFEIPATVRASFGLYNRTSEVDSLISALHRVREVFGL